MKQCSKCKEWKEESEFGKDSSRKNGVQNYCKKCRKEYYYINKNKIKEYLNINKVKIREAAKKYRYKNKNKIKEYRKEYFNNNKEYFKKYNKEYGKEYRNNNKDKSKEYNDKYYYENKNKIKERSLKYYYENKNKIVEYKKEYLKNNINAKLALILRKRLCNAITYKGRVKSASILIGCEISFLKQYLESKFQEGMTWKNHGVHGWHIDHIIPCASFDLSKEEEQRKCFHYTNLQPLWAKDNMSKGAKLDWKKEDK
jgi:hypothetical protein